MRVYQSLSCKGAVSSVVYKSCSLRQQSCSALASVGTVGILPFAAACVECCCCCLLLRPGSASQYNSFSGIATSVPGSCMEVMFARQLPQPGTRLLPQAGTRLLPPSTDP